MLYDLISTTLAALMLIVAALCALRGAMWLCGGSRVALRDLPATVAACAVAVFCAVTGR